MTSTKTFSCSFYYNGVLQRHLDCTSDFSDLNLLDDLYQWIDCDHTLDDAQDGDDYYWVVQSYPRCLIPA